MKFGDMTIRLCYLICEKNHRDHPVANSCSFCPLTRKCPCAIIAETDLETEVNLDGKDNTKQDK